MEKKPVWLGAALVWAGAVIVWLGMFLPWETFTGAFGTLTASGFAVAGLENVVNGFGQPLLIHHDYLYLVPVCALLAALVAGKAASLNKGGINYGPWLLLGLALVAVVCCVLFYSGVDTDRRILIISAMDASGGAAVSLVGAVLMGIGAIGVWYSTSTALLHQLATRMAAASSTSHAADGSIESPPV